MKEQDFSSAKVGDKAWSIPEGDTVIIRIDNDDHPIVTTDHNYYTLSGKYNESDAAPSLFWSNPNIIAPEKPKREIEKEYKLTIHYIHDSIELVMPDIPKDFFKQNVIEAKLVYKVLE